MNEKHYLAEIQKDKIEILSLEKDISIFVDLRARLLRLKVPSYEDWTIENVESRIEEMEEDIQLCEQDIEYLERQLEDIQAECGEDTGSVYSEEYMESQS